MRDGDVFNLNHVLHPKRQRTERAKKYQKEYWKKIRKELDVLIGDKCILCNSKLHVEFHEIHGKPHKAGNQKLRYMRNHYKDFVPLCVLCHRIVHALGKVKNREKLEELVMLVETGKPDITSITSLDSGHPNN